MSILHFVYSGDPCDDSATRAPQTITNHIFRYLEKRVPVQYYDVNDAVTIPAVGAGDVLLAHPWSNPHCVFNKLIRNSFKRIFLIWPFHSLIPEINRYVLPYAPLAEKLLMISGPYWIDSIGTTEFASFKEKVVRLDNAIDRTKFPYVKRQFNPPGCRGLFVIGRSGSEKGTSELFSLLKRVKGRVLVAGEYDSEDLQILAERPDTEFLGYIQMGNLEVQEHIAKQCDYFVNFSISDASPTTLFETMSMGLLPVSTPQCGYYYPSIIPLRLGDTTGNLTVLSSLQTIDESAMGKAQSECIRLIESNHSWSNFCETLWNAIAGSFGETPVTEFSEGQMIRLHRFVQTFSTLFNERKVLEAIAYYEQHRSSFPSSPKLVNLDSIVVKLRSRPMQAH